jgi:pyruvate-formate lyase-activating enzyme
MKIRTGPDGHHFFDRSTGMNILVDEVRPAEKSWSQAPRQVSIALTNVCDLHCAYCYAPKSRASLTADQVLAWLLELDEAGCLAVGFGGGEPTLHRQFVEICRRASQETKLAVTFTTHGHRLTDHLLGSLAGSANFIRVSVDGVGSTYESHRGRKYDELVARLSGVAQVLPFGINVVVNDRTIGELDALAELAHRFKATELLLLPQQATAAVEVVSQELAARLQKWVRSYDGAVRLAISEAGADGLPTCDPLPGEKELRAYAHIDASGMLRASSYSMTATPIGGTGVMAALDRLQKTLSIQREANS